MPLSIYTLELLISKPSGDSWTLRSDGQGLLHILRTISVRGGLGGGVGQWTAGPRKIEKSISWAIFQCKSGKKYGEII